MSCQHATRGAMKLERFAEIVDKDAPASRPVQRSGVISSRAILGGLHHHYARV